MGGLFKFIADVLRPIVTILVTVFVGAFVLSVFWPAADAWIISHVPAWERLAPAIAQVREWLGIHQPEPDPWWRFW
ncbi:MAG: hypothetical protein JJU26_06930 [Oceanicaulis sp.]|uniref:hypothetical protein n=1 Tax=Glycocaulis sp. TaxID=1969725 RepID=UPI0025C4A33D|nr:hypothetical protein [Glycocaulis sp.]MCC5981438.1 hypothetical protein [Oceanicaulis sp.]MCH8521735.1 hypothetical protein [Glycocaulis sp.]